MCWQETRSYKDSFFTQKLRLWNALTEGATSYLIPNRVSN